MGRNPRLATSETLGSLLRLPYAGLQNTIPQIAVLGDGFRDVKHVPSLTTVTGLLDFIGIFRTL